MDVMALRRALMITNMSNGEPIPAGCEIGTFMPTVDSDTYTITHTLGVVPKMAVCLDVINRAWGTVPAKTIIYEALMADPETGVFDISGNSGHKRNDVVSINGTGTAFEPTYTYTTYPAVMSSTEVTFATGQYYSGKFKANEKYIYILIK